MIQNTGIVAQSRLRKQRLQTSDDLGHTILGIVLSYVNCIQRRAHSVLRLFASTRAIDFR